MDPSVFSFTDSICTMLLVFTVKTLHSLITEKHKMWKSLYAKNHLFIITITIIKLNKSLHPYTAGEKILSWLMFCAAFAQSHTTLECKNTNQKRLEFIQNTENQGQLIGCSKVKYTLKVSSVQHQL